MAEDKVYTVAEVEQYIANTEKYLDGVPDEILVKASGVAALTVQEATGFTGEAIPPKRVEDWLKLYTTHVWSYVSIYAIANTIAKLKWELWKKNKITGDLEKVDFHPIMDLLEHPNPNMTGYDLKESLATYLELAGNTYWELVYGSSKLTTADGKKIRQLKKRQPVQIFNIRPDRLVPKPRKDGKGVEKWIFQARKSGRKKDLALKEVVPFEYFNPIADFFGLGTLCAASDEILQDLHMIKWNDGFFRDGMIPQGIISADQPITKSKMEDIAAQLRQFLIGKGRKVLVLGSNMKWQQIAVKPTDVDFSGGRKENKLAVLSAAGVPPVMAGELGNAKFDNYRLQLESFHKETILPKLKKIESALATHFIPRFPDLVPTDEFEWVLLFDTTELIQEDKDKLTARIMNQIKHALLTPNEGRKMLGFEPYPAGVVGGDDFYMLTNIQGLNKALSEEGLERSEDDLQKSVSQLQVQVTEAIENMRQEIKQEILDEIG